MEIGEEDLESLKEIIKLGVTTTFTANQWDEQLDYYFNLLYLLNMEKS